MPAAACLQCSLEFEFDCRGDWFSPGTGSLAPLLAARHGIALSHRQHAYHAVSLSAWPPGNLLTGAGEGRQGRRK